MKTGKKSIAFLLTISTVFSLLAGFSGVFDLTATAQGISATGNQMVSFDNLALQKSVTASSAFNNGYRAQIAVDGSNLNDQMWFTIADPGLISWLTIDLGNFMEFDTVGIDYGNAGGNYTCTPKKLIVQTSNDGTIWSDVLTVDNTSYKMIPVNGDAYRTAQPFWDCYLGTTVNARYVRLYSPEGGTHPTATNMIALGEVQVFNGKRTTYNEEHIINAVTASSEYDTLRSAKAVLDGITGDGIYYWANKIDGTDNAPWLQFDIGTEKLTDKVAISFGTNGSTFSCVPKKIEVYAGNDPASLIKVATFTDGLPNDSVAFTANYFELSLSQVINARYIKLSFPDGSYHPSVPNMVGINEVKLSLGGYNSTFPGIITATATASSVLNSGYPAANLVNGTTTEWASTTTATNLYVQFDLQKLNAVSAISIYFAQSGGVFWVVPKKIVVQWSLDGTNFFDADVITSDMLPVQGAAFQAKFFTYNLSNSLSARYIRLSFPEGGKHTGVPNMVMLNEVRIQGTTVMASSEFPGGNNPPNNLLNGIGTDWASTTDAINPYVQLDLLKPNAVSGVSLYYSNSGGVFWVVPKKVVVQWSLDGTNFKDADVITSDMIPAQGATFEARYFTYNLSRPLFARYIRLSFPEGGKHTGVPNMVMLDEVRILSASAQTFASSNTPSLYKPNEANDGLLFTNNNLWSSDGTTLDSWFMLDLMSNKNFDSINVDFAQYNGLYSQTPDGFEIQISDDGVSYQTVKTVAENEIPESGVTATNTLYTYNLDATYNARYVRLYFASGSKATPKNNVQLGEVGISLNNVNFGTYKISTNNNYISNIYQNKTVAAFKQGLTINVGTVSVISKNGIDPLADTSLITTGTIVQTSTDGKSYTVVIYGDVDGTGAIDLTDLAAIKSHLLQINSLSSLSLKAGDTTGKGKVTISDLLAVKKSILNLATINQNF